MKAIVYSQYGTADVLHLKDVARPTPKEGEVLIKVHAAALNFSDLAFLSGTPFVIRLAAGLQTPKNPILGADVAGRVEAVGKNVTSFRVGDAVFGDLSNCGRGGLAEYVTAPANVLVRKPEKISFEQAAAVPMAGVTALQGLRTKGQIEPGQKVLINGASGGVGTFAVQIAKALLTEVTAVCSTGNIALARSLGADHVIDYTKEDFTQSGKQYDLILAANGYHTLAAYKRALASKGIYVMTGGTMPQIFEAMLQGPWMSMGGSQKMLNLESKPNTQDLTFLSMLLETGKIVPVIAKRYALRESAEAFRYLATGHAQGKVVINLEEAA